MLRLRYVALLLAVGCSPVKDASNVPDASIDAMDTRPPMIASSNPANMATKVSILQPISVFFDEPLDPASVTAETVKLGYEQMPPDVYLVGVNARFGAGHAGLLPVKGAVSYDAVSRKVSFLPAAPLPYGSIFTLSIDVKDTAGLTFTSKLTFTTYVNLNTKQHFFTSNGLPSFWYGFAPDMNGWQAKRISMFSPGPDTLWFNDDDPRSEHWGYAYSADGRISNVRLYDYGTDGRLDTPDDVVFHCVSYGYDAEGRLAQRAYAGQAGADTMFCTGDDIPSSHTVYEYTDGALVGWVINNSPGDDGMWRNSDDRCSRYYDVEYDAQGNRTREIQKNCGADLRARTSDDTFFHYYEYEYNADHQLVKMTWRTGPGPDGVWLAGDDDVISQMERYVRNADGLVTELFLSSSAGSDAMWGTPDDLGSRTSTKYNAQKLPEEITLYSSFGPDSIWGNDNDVISNYQKLTYNELGNRTDLKIYAAGPDGMWRTGDDRVTQDWDFDVRD